MTSIAEQEAWKEVRGYLEDAVGMDFDGCHKIYLLMDEESWDYSHGLYYEHHVNLDTLSTDEALAMVQGWFEQSCGLEFVNAIVNGGNHNDDFTQVIPQAAYWDWYPEEGDE